MTKKNICCTLCPLGCTITVKIQNGHCHICSGNQCPLGIKYATKEALHPKRIVTTSVRVQGGEWPLVSVKTTLPVPIKKIIPIIKETKKITIDAPIVIGQTLSKDIAGTKTNLIATKNIRKKRKK